MRANEDDNIERAVPELSAALMRPLIDFYARADLTDREKAFTIHIIGGSLMDKGSNDIKKA